MYFDKKDINNLHLAALGYQLLYYLNSSHYEENLTFHAVSADNKYSDENLHILEQFTNNDITEDSDITLLNNAEVYIKNDNEPISIKPLWRSMLNLASGDQIYQHKIEKLLYNTLDEVRFHYGRIYHVFSPQFIPPKSFGKAHTYYNFAETIDMLKTAGVCPYINLSENMSFIVNPSGDMKTNFSINLDDYLEMVSSLLSFSINLYGANEVGSWIFEISWYCYYNNGLWENPKAFARRFTETYKLIKSCIPQATVGGIGYDSPVPSNHFSEILEELLRLDASPDFISFGIFPYEFTHSWNSEQHPPKLFYTSDSHYALHKITEYKRQMHRYKNFRCPIHISVLATSMHQNIVLNDSCYQASFFAQSTIDLVNEVDIIGYFQMADITFCKQESITLLEGKNGLINVFGIYKPGLLALSILNQSGLRLIAKGENYLITQRNQNSYSVFFCNHIHVNDKFCINLENNLALEDTYAAFNPPQTKYIQFRMDNLPPGNYVIIGYHINREMGSLLDEWAKIDYWNHPDRNELDYLKHIIHYKRTLSKRICKDGENSLSFPIQLAPHEVAIYLITLMA